MSRLALTPVNVPVSATNISTPTLRAGDMYYNTINGLMIYNGTTWMPAGFGRDVDGGDADSIAPLEGGYPDTTSTQTFDGGTP